MIVLGIGEATLGSPGWARAASRSRTAPPDAEQGASLLLSWNRPGVTQVGVLLLSRSQDGQSDTRRATRFTRARFEVPERAARQLVQPSKPLLGESQTAGIAVEQEQRRTSQVGRVEQAPEIRRVAHAQHR